MKRLAFVFLMIGVCVMAVRITSAFEARHETPAAERAAEPASEGEEGKLELWKWANFVVLAVGIGYLVGRNAGPFFTGRTRKIRKDLIEATELRKEAETRAAEVERRLANLEAEIAELRAESQREAEAETERQSQQAAAEMAKIQGHARQEIAAASKAAQMELKRYAAQIAVEVAEQKVRARITPESDDSLVHGFVRDLDNSSARAQTI